MVDAAAARTTKPRRRVRRKHQHRKHQQRLSSRMMPLPTCWEERSDENSRMMSTAAMMSSHQGPSLKQDMDALLVLDSFKAATNASPPSSQNIKRRTVQGCSERIPVTGGHNTALRLKSKSKSKSKSKPESEPMLSTRKRSSDPVQLYAQHQAEWCQMTRPSQNRTRILKRREYVAQHVVHGSRCEKPLAHFHGQVRAPGPRRLFRELVP